MNKTTKIGVLVVITVLFAGCTGITGDTFSTGVVTKFRNAGGFPCGGQWSASILYIPPGTGQGYGLGHVDAELYGVEHGSPTEQVVINALFYALNTQQKIRFHYVYHDGFVSPDSWCKWSESRTIDEVVPESS